MEVGFKKRGYSRGIERIQYKKYQVCQDGNEKTLEKLNKVHSLNEAVLKRRTY